MPITYYTFLAGSLALAGIFPFAGFWSKDEVLYEALVHGLNSPLLLGAYAMGLLAVFFTGFYTFRMVFLTFHGDPRTEAARQPHGVGWTVKFPLVVLGVLAVTAGFINMVPVAKLTGLHIEFLHDWLDGGATALSSHHYGDLLVDHAGYDAGNLSPLIPGLLSLGLALAGSGLAYSLYAVRQPRAHVERLGSIKTLVFNNYYQDEYQVWLATGLTVPLARAADTFDQGVIDGIVNLTSSVSLFAGRRIRRIQTGVVTNYAAMLALAVLALVVAFAFAGGWF